MELLLVITIFVVTAAQRNCVVKNATSIMSKSVIEEMAEDQSAEKCSEHCENRTGCRSRERPTETFNGPTGLVSGSSTYEYDQIRGNRSVEMKGIMEYPRLGR
jgi:hypothetical protein